MLAVPGGHHIVWRPHHRLPLLKLKHLPTHSLCFPRSCCLRVFYRTRLLKESARTTQLGVRLPPSNAILTADAKSFGHVCELSLGHSHDDLQELLAWSYFFPPFLVRDFVFFCSRPVITTSRLPQRDTASSGYAHLKEVHISISGCGTVYLASIKGHFTGLPFLNKFRPHPFGTRLTPIPPPSFILHATW